MAVTIGLERRLVFLKSTCYASFLVRKIPSWKFTSSKLARHFLYVLHHTVIQLQLFFNVDLYRLLLKTSVILFQQPVIRKYFFCSQLMILHIHTLDLYKTWKHMLPYLNCLDITIFYCKDYH